MFWTLAWRNVWRNKKRSAVVLLAVAFGVWAGLLTAGLMFGMTRQMVDSAVEVRISHLQIHAPGFRSHPEIAKVIPHGFEILSHVKQMPEVKAACGRVVIAGMASSPTTGVGITIYGVEPGEERSVSLLPERIVEGTWFGSQEKDPVVIGKELADKLGVGLGGKIVLQGQSLDGSIGGGAFRIVGLYRTVSSQYDESSVFALRPDVERAFGLAQALHEIAIMVRDVKDIPTVESELKTAYPGLDVASWKGLAPEIGIIAGTTAQTVNFFVAVILLALVFGITNTMLMGVLERVRELGVIIALGMKSWGIFVLILLETLFLSLIGAALGIGMGVFTLAFLSRTGINLSIVSQGLAEFGMSTVLYPSLPWFEYPLVGGLVILTAALAAIYPGIKAVRLNPVAAIRTY